MFKTELFNLSRFLFWSLGFWIFEFVSKLGTRPKGGETEGPISIFEFRIYQCSASSLQTSELELLLFQGQLD
jgi:hypothetical protein